MTTTSPSALTEATCAKAKICTQYDPKPIPDRRFDWSAWEDGGDEHQTGWGATEAEAVQELTENLEAQRAVDFFFAPKENTNG